MDKENLIEKYLAGHASDAELLELKKLVENDKSLQQDVALQRLMTGLIRVQDEKNFHSQLSQLSQKVLRPKMGKRQHNNQRSDQEKAKVKSLFSKQWITAIAAAITLIIVAVVVLNQSGINSQDLYTSYYQPFSAKNVRGNAKEVLQTSMINAYNLGNYQDAKSLLLQLLNQNPENADRLTLLLANCHLNLNSPNESIRLLQSLDNTNNEFKEDAQWYLILSYLKADKIAKAKQVIQKTKQNSNHLYSVKIKEIEKKIQD